jgi:very-short-patch-repair endonuclease
MILRLAFQDLTGALPTSDQLTGGRASVRVLQNIGFNAIYDKPRTTANRNPIKNARRHAFKEALAARWGEVRTEERLPGLSVPSLAARNKMRSDLLQILNAIESVRGLSIRGRERHALRCDLYLPVHRLIIEFDEKQHFTPLRAASLKAYPPTVRLGFPKERWVTLCDEIRAGDNSPIYRDEQRAFYDAVRDILVPELGYRPVVRVFENDVAWETESAKSVGAKRILSMIEGLVGQSSPTRTCSRLTPRSKNRGSAGL